MLIYVDGVEKELRYEGKDGCDMMPDLAVGTDIKFNTETGNFEVSKEDYAWWENWVSLSKAADDKCEVLCNGMSAEKEQEFKEFLRESIAFVEFGDVPKVILSACAEWEEVQGSIIE